MRLNIYLTNDDKRLLDDVVDKTGLKMSELVRRAIKQYSAEVFEEDEEKPKKAKEREDKPVELVKPKKVPKHSEEEIGELIEYAWLFR